MWVKRNSKTIFLDLSEYFLNFGYLEEERLKKIISETKFNEVIKLSLPEKLTSAIQEAFTALDYEENGYVRARDVKVTLRALGIESTSNKMKKLIERVTTKKSDELSRQDYEKIMLEVIHDIDSDEQMIQSFHMFDTNRSGVISKEDLRRLAEQLELVITDEEMQEMINIADSDKDGRVTKEDFIDIARKIF